ncbi:MAG: helix-turn-helix domain-containing protein [Fusobacteriota bacterium]
MTFGEKIKERRRTEGYSLRVLAKKVGLSASFLSQIEQGKTSPSIENLKKIANALDVKVSYLIEDNVRNKDTVVTRKQNRDRVESLDSKTKISLLTTSNIDKKMEPIYYEIEPGGKSGKGSYSHLGEEFVFIVSGELDIYIEGRKETLKSGDSMYFKSTQEHKFINNSEKKTKVVWVVTPPTF